jgi:S-adenosylhomocysteine hydrolase
MNPTQYRDEMALKHYEEFQKKDEEAALNGNVVIEKRYGSFCYGFDCAMAYRDERAKVFVNNIDMILKIEAVTDFIKLDMVKKLLAEFTEIK